MSQLKDILNKMFSIANKSSDQYGNIWLQRSAKDSEGDYINQPTNVEQMKEDKSRDFIYNLWARTTEEGLSDMDKFVETELIPNGMSLFKDKDTGKAVHFLSKDKGSIRFMVARPNLDSAS
tara:strand:+ start:75 stop:437 length:363 start_codon:yes stop_codon:yes gene_type:complete